MGVLKKLKAAAAIIAASLMFSCAGSPAYAVQAEKYDKVQVVRVIDGDTVEMTVDLGFGVSKTDKFRLYGIDTPEKKQAGNAEATATVKRLIEGKQVSIDYYKQDKYGRQLAVIYVLVDDKLVDVNFLLVQHGLAKPYFGGKKGE